MKRSDITDEQVVAACSQFNSTRERGKPFVSDILMQKTGAPFKVVMAAMERTHKRGLIDYGVSLRTAWPVEN